MLKTAPQAAAAGLPLHIDDEMAEFRRFIIVSPINAPADHHRSSDAGADGQNQSVLIACAGAGGMLSDQSAVCVIVQKYRHLKPFGNPDAQRLVQKRKVSRPKHISGLRIYQPR